MHPIEAVITGVMAQSEVIANYTALELVERTELTKVSFRVDIPGKDSLEAVALADQHFDDIRSLAGNPMSMSIELSEEDKLDAIVILGDPFKVIDDTVYEARKVIKAERNELGQWVGRYKLTCLILRSQNGTDPTAPLSV
jgi:predicted MPP superfamily phosphohydrolase